MIILIFRSLESIGVHEGDIFKRGGGGWPEEEIWIMALMWGDWWVEEAESELGLGWKAWDRSQQWFCRKKRSLIIIRFRFCHFEMNECYAKSQKQKELRREKSIKTTVLHVHKQEEISTFRSTGFDRK